MVHCRQVLILIIFPFLNSNGLLLLKGPFRNVVIFLANIETSLCFKFSISLLQKYVAQKLVRGLEFTGQARKFIDHCVHQIQLKPGIGLNFIF